jgi:hypothetical protein
MIISTCQSYKRVNYNGQMDKWLVKEYLPIAAILTYLT